MNRGARLARRKLAERGAKAALARELGIRLDRLSKLLKGDRLPNPKERAHFEDHLRIRWRLWDQPIEPKGKAAA
jgi:hypothetical protein